MKISGQNDSRYGYDSGLHPHPATYRGESDDANQLILSRSVRKKGVEGGREMAGRSDRCHRKLAPSQSDFAGATVSISKRSGELTS